MVDLSMQYALVSALTAKSRLILLGDRDQLASVDAGNVLGDIVGQASPHQYSSDQQKVLQACCPGFNTIDAADDAGGMADVIVQLQHSYRFDEKSGIGHFAKAVNQGNAELACAVGDDPRFEDQVFVDTETVSLHAQLKIQALSSAQALLAADSALEAISHLSHFKVLCAIQNGHRGVAGINDFMELQLMQLGLIPANELWYQGRPLLITRNDRGTDLYNGDTGLIWPDDEGNNMAWFPDGTGHARAIAPGRLPAHQTCFAITVHKTQGSEFSNVLLVLPDPPHTLLSRDLLYTGVTRAKHAVTVYGSKSAICIATNTKRIRASGLYDRLWQDYPSRSG
jgi:exodeoxyribonuclease V alpha subunit